MNADEIVKAYQKVASTEDGQIVLRDILRLTGYQENPMRYDPATFELNPNATLYNVAQGTLWLQIQKRLTLAQRAEIEHGETNT